MPSSLLPEGPDLDPEFSTAGDYLFAKFIAYERLQEYLISCFYHRASDEPALGKPKRKAMNWTGDKSNLIELANALYGTQQINEGKITISEIIEWLEASFINCPKLRVGITILPLAVAIALRRHGA